MKPVLLRAAQLSNKLQKSLGSWLAPVVKSMSIGLLFMSFGAVAATDVERLQQQLASVDSWSAEFDQTVKDSNGAVLQSLTGRLDLQKPMQFYWETQNPFPQVLVSNGAQLWVYDQDLDQVVIREMNEQIAPMPAAILSGRLDDVSEHFTVQREEVENTQIVRFKLRPLEEGDGDFEALTLEFYGGVLNRLRLDDTLGQVTDLVFRAVSLNPGFKPSRFEFTVPPDVDVIDERVKPLAAQPSFDAQPSLDIQP